MNNFFSHQPNSKPSTKPGRFVFLMLAVLLLVLVVAGWKHKDQIVDLDVQRLTFLSSSTTPVSGIWSGSVSFDSTETTGTLSLTGVAATDKVFAAFTSGNSSGVGVKSAAPATDAVNLTLTGQPGASSTVSVLVLR